MTTFEDQIFKFHKKFSATTTTKAPGVLGTWIECKLVGSVILTEGVI